MASRSTGRALEARDQTTGKSLTALLMEPEAERRIGPLLFEGLRSEDDKQAAMARVRALVAKAGRVNPLILNCSGTSILDAVATIAGWHLEIGSTAHLVPYGKKCTAVMDYKGMAQLMIASGAVRYVWPFLVYENELKGDPPRFRLRAGTEPGIDHDPILKTAERGPIAGAYVVLQTRGQHRPSHFMSRDDIDAIRRRYSKQYANGPLDDIPWYAIKTVIRQMAKLMPTASAPQLAKVFGVIRSEEEMELGPVVDDVNARLAAGQRQQALDVGSPGDFTGDEMEPGEEEFQDDSDLVDR